MSTLNDAAYYHRRAEHAQAAADAAISPQIRHIHLDMASRYAELAILAESSANAPAPTLRLVR